jgi:hypothetical protein
MSDGCSTAKERQALDHHHRLGVVVPSLTAA